LLEKVYSYIVEHSGVISLREAASELGVTPEQVKQATERLKRQGRLE
jgi:Mn-dependent DtxR family transcriptional regulator